MLSNCPDCGIKLKEKSDYCPNCGSELIVKEQKQVVENKPEESKQESSCINCGKKSSTEYKFCPHCGDSKSLKKQQVKEKISQKDNKQVKAKGQKEKPASKKKIRPEILIPIFILVIVVFYFAADSAGLFEGKKDVNALITNANGLMDSGNYVDAIEEYKKVLEINPKNYDAKTDMGACLHTLGRNLEAKQVFEEVIKENPFHQIAMFNLGIVYSSLNEHDKAIECWNKTIELGPNTPTASNARSFLEKHNK